MDFPRFRLEPPRRRMCDAQGLHSYGLDAAAVLQLPGADQWLAEGLSEAMVRFAARYEYARTVEDVLARRSRLTLAEAEGRLVTTIEGLSGGAQTAEWYPAEDYHQEYWDGEGQRNPYCLAVIPPKLMKLRKSFAARVKS